MGTCPGVIETKGLWTDGERGPIGGISEICGAEDRWYFCGEGLASYAQEAWFIACTSGDEARSGMLPKVGRDARRSGVESIPSAWDDGMGIVGGGPR